MGQVRVKEKVEMPEGRVAAIVVLLKERLKSVSLQKCHNLHV